MPDIFTYRNVSSQTPVGKGLLAGRKVVIQPNMSVRGWLTNAGSRALEGFVALEDATTIIRLREAGAALIGSSLMSELGFGLSGDTGAQVLSGEEAHIALITDTMGEARIAASTSGFFGFKPSFGIVSRFGLIGIVPSMECYGIVSKNLKDIITTIGVISGKDTNDLSMPDEALPHFNKIEEPLETKCVVGVIKESLGVLDDKEVKAFKAGIAKLEEAGFTIREVTLEGFELFRTVHNVIGSVEASSSVGKYDGVRYGHRTLSAKNWNDMYLNSRRESFGTLIKTYLFQGAYFQFENYPAFENACRIRQRLVQGTAYLFEYVDTIIFPTWRPRYDPVRATTINEIYDAFLLTLPANITGQPSLHIPSIAIDSGSDLGIQLVGPRLSDARLLALGMRISSIVQGANRS